MIKRVWVLSLLGAVLLLPGCSALAKVGKVGKVAGTMTKGAKATTAVKGASAAVAVKAVDDVARVGDDAFSLARLGGKAGKEEVAFVVDDIGSAAEAAGAVAKHGDTAAEIAADVLIELASNSDFVDWCTTSAPEEVGDQEYEVGQDAPEEVSVAFRKALPEALPITSAEQFQGRYWAQWFRLPKGERVAVYDTRSQAVGWLKPQLKGAE